MTSFSDRVLSWFETCGRKDLPWQQDPSPYSVWVSEIMLQQTQVATVIPYYQRFMQSFPDVAALADAEVDAVLHHWSGLGYYARARNLHKSAVIIRDDFGGVFPAAFDDVVALPGIGRSTAGAILSLARNERHPILDGNVKRVLARHFGVDGWPGQPAVARKLWRLADDNTPPNSVANYNQAMMDLGATVCTRSKPDCGHCPVDMSCLARQQDRIRELPGRKPKKDKPRKETWMVLACCDDDLWLERRPPSGIWGGLWSFPELENADDATAWCQRRFAVGPQSVEQWEVLRHSFSHYDLDIRPLVVRVTGASRKVADNVSGEWYSLNETPAVGLAAPVDKLMKTLQATRQI